MQILELYIKTDNLDKAVECYQLALSIKPNLCQSLNNLVIVYTVQGKMNAASSMIEKAIVANPTYAEAYNNLGKKADHANDVMLCLSQGFQYCLNNTYTGEVISAKSPLSNNNESNNKSGSGLNTSRRLQIEESPIPSTSTEPKPFSAVRCRVHHKSHYK
uniref:Probable UDP-N-acetylglucosamine--peptide N-acetylglucosaminyltransferase SPINDLY n=1 Tax=Tanacetum cinerariifolium TaxID=118510 RepID=A0A6L2K8D6_TANCI|nr:probable UDP-N-acetylglucosamine--peptide N-acetylglucosaminyltransferase SPINDLY [Tanacetum cinerariifolium]